MSEHIASDLAPPQLPAMVEYVFDASNPQFPDTELACADAAVADDFFRGEAERPRSYKPREADLVTDYCLPCPARLACLSTALSRPYNKGLFGGVTQEDRNQLRRAMGTKGLTVQIPRQVVDTLDSPKAQDRLIRALLTAAKSPEVAPPAPREYERSNADYGTQLLQLLSAGALTVSPRDTPIRQICENLAVSQSKATAIVRMLERLGLVDVRRVEERSKRQHIVAISVADVESA